MAEQQVCNACEDSTKLPYIDHEKGFCCADHGPMTTITPSRGVIRFHMDTSGPRL